MVQITLRDFKRLLTPSLFVGLGLLLYGLIYFSRRWGYSETGHELIVALYCIFTFLFALTFQFKRYFMTAMSGFILVALLVYGGNKFEWRETYIEEASKGDFPAIEQYIDNYPLYEEHHFANLLGHPRWLAYSEECLEPALAGEPMAEECQTADLILQHYGFNIYDLINKHYDKMRETALRLQKGTLTNAQSYKACLQSKNCAFIPLLPADAKLEEITEMSKDYIEIRKQFWSLIHNETIQPETCQFMDLCRVMQNASVIEIRQTL